MIPAEIRSPETLVIVNGWDGSSWSMDLDLCAKTGDTAKGAPHSMVFSKEGGRWLVYRRAK